MAVLPSHFENLASLLPDYSIPVYSTSPLSVFKSFLRSQKNLVSAFLLTKFAQHLMDSVEYSTLIASSKSARGPVTFNLLPSPLVSDVSLSLSFLALGTSFRFLGVWFFLSASSQFVLKQARSMFKNMAALLGPKKLLAQHVAYLYNAVLLPIQSKIWPWPPCYYNSPSFAFPETSLLNSKCFLSVPLFPYRILEKLFLLFIFTKISAKFFFKFFHFI
ncbi:unnamed protein product [Rhizophagus irregularis]|nr:unnamed protein product [Rhizophagus irregularis]